MLIIMVLGVIVYIIVCVHIIDIGHLSHECDVFLLLGSVCLLSTAGIVCLLSRSLIQVIMVSPAVIVMCTFASAGVAMVLSLMSKPSTCHAFQFAFESAIACVMVHELADPATCLQGQGAILIVRVAGNLAGKRGSSIVAAVSE